MRCTSESSAHFTNIYIFLQLLGGTPNVLHDVQDLDAVKRENLEQTQMA